jgi:FixJ family two-component response regulator
MDINIGGRLTGVDVGKAVAHLHIPIFYMTAIIDPAYELETRSALTFGYLRKPVEKYTLTTALNDALTRASSFSREKIKQEHPRISFSSGKTRFFTRLITPIFCSQSQ